MGHGINRACSDT